MFLFNPNCLDLTDIRSRVMSKYTWYKPNMQSFVHWLGKLDIRPYRFDNSFYQKTSPLEFNKGVEKSEPFLDGVEKKTLIS